MEALLCWQVAMASGHNMMAPICLVENNNEQLSVNQKALQILDKISQPVVVVAIVGLYRTGKSYLMNRLAGQNHGFSLGSTVQSETKGIWMWCVPHPSKPNHTLVLLDTEGLGDVEKGDPKNDSWIFALAVLLSSSFVYNSMSTINHQALEQLQYVTELTELIRAKSSPSPEEVEDSSEFVSFFPDFIWTVRDFTLELKLNGRPITEDEYLENALKLVPGRNPKVQMSNLPRECIRHFFPKRKCFVFDRPTNDKELLANIENVTETQLDPKFQEQIKNFCSYVFSQARTKTLREGIMVTGKRLGTLVVTYVDAINSGAVPCLENAVTTLAQLENSAAVQKAADHYSEQMAQRVRFPTDTLQELLDLHAACEREATEIFMENSFKDENQEFQKKLVEILKNKKENFLLQNEEASAKYCQAKLDQLSTALEQSISAGIFSVSGGHKLYMETKERIERDYWQVPRKGVKANEVFHRFLQSQAAIEKSILQSDKVLTDGEKAIAEERARKQAAEKEQELLRQQLQEQQLRMEAQERSLQENIIQLKEKLERERENAIRERNMMLDHKLKVQEELLKDGFKKKSEEMNAEINHLKNIIDSTRNDDTPWLAKTLDKIGNELTSILCAPAKLVDTVVRGVSSLFKKK
ncbi:guanylate-binding protein 6-like isoform X1 [Rhinolophus ferrumequinum]|uniref:guanylate-binding protein 6-like isoform X1 n=1 Tax=Rhinolophus ferrumequinum TaxID=59479 RepID=UPI00140FE5D6|nr:guanylate-binding protein 6-like isoform X1 [Rhinolophus ferrumequinum]